MTDLVGHNTETRSVLYAVDREGQPVRLPGPIEELVSVYRVRDVGESAEGRMYSLDTVLRARYCIAVKGRRATLYALPGQGEPARPVRSVLVELPPGASLEPPQLLELLGLGPELAAEATRPALLVL